MWLKDNPSNVRALHKIVLIISWLKTLSYFSAKPSMKNTTENNYNEKDYDKNICLAYLYSSQSNHLAFFRRTLGKRLGRIGTMFRVTLSTNTAGADPKFVQKQV